MSNSEITPDREGKQGEPLRSAQGAPAAPEYPIRALLRVGADNGIPAHLEGTVFRARRTGSDLYALLDVDSPSNPWVALGKSVIINPTPQDIAEERAKAGLPATDGAAVPERSEGSPSLPSDPVVPMGGGVEAWRKLLDRAMEHVGPCYCNRRIGYECEICDIRKDYAALAKLEGK